MSDFSASCNDKSLQIVPRSATEWRFWLNQYGAPRNEKKSVKRFWMQALREFSEAAVILSVSAIACTLTIRWGILERLYSISRGETAFTFDSFNAILLFLSIATTTFGVRRVVSQRQELRRRVAAEHYARLVVLRDPVTQLPNRRSFEHELERLLSPPAKSGTTLLLIKLIGFEALTDLLGHSSADALLLQAAARLREHLAGKGRLARFGDDEFAICLASMDGEAATRLAIGIIDTLKQPVMLGSQTHSLRVTIGIAQTNFGHVKIGELLRRAHVALHRARNANANCGFFDQEMDSHIRERSMLIQELRTALLRNQMRPYYQPIIHLASNRIVAFEALARWDHPTKGSISPAVFIPLAEDLGLIDQLTEQLFLVACRDAARWPKHVSLSFNFSPKQLRDITLPERVLGIMQQTGLQPNRLEAEVTEGALVEDLSTARQVLEALRAAGASIVMDDFGTGFSSLYHLRELRFDKLKIDRSFVQALGKSRDSDVIVRAIMGMSQGLELVVTAEGVETAEQGAALAGMGVQQVQGFLFSRPMPSGKVRQFLRTTEPVPMVA